MRFLRETLLQYTTSFVKGKELAALKQAIRARHPDRHPGVDPSDARDLITILNLMNENKNTLTEEAREEQNPSSPKQEAKDSTNQSEDTKEDDWSEWNSAPEPQEISIAEKVKGIVSKCQFDCPSMVHSAILAISDLQVGISDEFIPFYIFKQNFAAISHVFCYKRRNGERTQLQTFVHQDFLLDVTTAKTAGEVFAERLPPVTILRVSRVHNQRPFIVIDTQRKYPHRFSATKHLRLDRRYRVTVQNTTLHLLSLD